MKNKIYLKLASYFMIALLTFSLILGIIFISLFSKYNINVHKTELEKRAVSISQQLSEFWSGKMKGYNMYLSFIEDIAMTDVWIIDNNLELSSCNHEGHGMENDTYKYSDLPENAEEIIKSVFNGEISFSENFSSVLKVPTLTVGVPIKLYDESIVGVVLLHTSIKGINEAIWQGITIFIISVVIALFISLILSMCFSNMFTKPLNKMKNITSELALGNYNSKTNIIQNDEIGELAKNIDILSSKLYEADNKNKKLEQMRNDFVANVSHELKTPITIIRGLIESLCDKIVTEKEEVHDYYNQIFLETKSLQRLIGDLLDLSKLQNTDFVIEMEPINLYSILDDAIKSIIKLSEQKNINLKFINNSKNINVIGDYGRLRQMFIIILHNAVKFSPENGSIKINIFEEMHLIVSISDEGKGIPEKDLPYIFDRFYKTKSLENKNGTGLGLSIAKQICVRHNIDIKVENNSLKGCTFIFLFNSKKSGI